MEASELDLLAQAMDHLFPQTEHDCHNGWCDVDERCTDDVANCDACRARAAYKALNAIATPLPTPVHEYRLTNPPERIYVERWTKENERHRGMNHGFTLLEHLMKPRDQKQVPIVSHRDALVAVSVVQWFGTSCGMGFIHECERQIREERLERHAWGDECLAYEPEAEHQTEIGRIAHQIADVTIPSTKTEANKRLATLIIRGFKWLTRVDPDAEACNH